MTNEKQTEIVVINETMLQSKIHIVRGQKVMLDFELAEIYGYTTKAFNQQVKNNDERFDEDFRFKPGARITSINEIFTEHMYDTMIGSLINNPDLQLK